MDSATDIVRNFSALQQDIVETFLRVVAPKDMEYFRDVRDGTLSVDGIKWMYERHGRGIRFIGDDGRVVDVHIGLHQHPAGVTAWRLLQYLESLQLIEMSFNQVTYSSEDEDELEQMLARMQDGGIVRQVEGKIYVPTTPSSN